MQDNLNDNIEVSTTQYDIPVHCDEGITDSEAGALQSKACKAQSELAQIKFNRP